MSDSSKSLNERRKLIVLAWAVLLYFGLPLLGELTARDLIEPFGTVLYFGSEGGGAGYLGFGLFPTTLLLITLPFVRRQRHQVLSQLWLYAIVIGILGMISDQALELLDYEAAQTAGILFTAIELTRWVILILLARRMSSISFRYSLLFIGLVVALGSPGTFVPQRVLYETDYLHPDLVQPTSVYVGLLLGKVAVAGAGIWSLSNAAYLMSSQRTLVGSLAVLIMLPTISVAIAMRYTESGDGLAWLLPVSTVMASFVVWNAVTLLVSYLTRVRGTQDLHDPSDSTPTAGPVPTAGT